MSLAVASGALPPHPRPTTGWAGVHADADSSDATPGRSRSAPGGGGVPRALQQDVGSPASRPTHTASVQPACRGLSTLPPATTGRAPEAPLPPPAGRYGNRVPAQPQEGGGGGLAAEKPQRAGAAARKRPHCACPALSSLSVPLGGGGGGAAWERPSAFPVCPSVPTLHP